MKTYYIMLTCLCMIILSSSCKRPTENPKNPAPINPQEQITTVQLTGYDRDQPGNASRQFLVKWEDLDGAGGNPPVFDTLRLDTGVVYDVRLVLIDKTKAPFDTISHEVEEEKNVHQFFYTTGASLSGKVNIEIQDFDDNSPALPVGLHFYLNTRTGSAYAVPLTGSLRIALSHYDGIPKTTSPAPETDLDIELPVLLH